MSSSGPNFKWVVSNHLRKMKREDNPKKFKAMVETLEAYLEHMLNQY